MSSLALSLLRFSILSDQNDRGPNSGGLAVVLSASKMVISYTVDWNLSPKRLRPILLAIGE